MSYDLTNRFRLASATFDATPTTYADLPFITVGQMILVPFSRGFSCQELEREPIENYITSMGSTSLAAQGFRELAKGIIQFIPGLD